MAVCLKSQDQDLAPRKSFDILDNNNNLIIIIIIIEKEQGFPYGSLCTIISTVRCLLDHSKVSRQYILEENDSATSFTNTPHALKTTNSD